MPHRGQPLVPISPAILVRRGGGLREVIGELIQKSSQTVVVEVAREVIRVKTGRVVSGTIQQGALSLPTHSLPPREPRFDDATL